jgi:hypothetical protein
MNNIYTGYNSAQAQPERGMRLCAKRWATALNLVLNNKLFLPRYFVNLLHEKAQIIF